MNRSDFIEAVGATRKAHEIAVDALRWFDSLLENNVYFDTKTAAEKIEDRLLVYANDDCEGSHNCGASSYTQEFIVGETHYIGTLSVDYNRHDKTYYYVDGYEFDCKVKE